MWLILIFGSRALGVTPRVIPQKQQFMPWWSLSNDILGSKIRFVVEKLLRLLVMPPRGLYGTQIIHLRTQSYSWLILSVYQIWCQSDRICDQFLRDRYALKWVLLRVKVSIANWYSYSKQTKCHWKIMKFEVNSKNPVLGC